MVDPITLPLLCPKCGGAIEVQCGPADDDPDPVRREWPCPHCQATHVYGGVGPVLWVSKGHHDSAPH